MKKIMIIPRPVTVKVVAVANDSSNRLEHQTRVLRKAIDKHQPKKVGVLMGSPNDYPKMKGAEDVLLHFGLTPDVRVMSAHRQPREVAEYACKARENDYAAIICGAGMAAHLAGAVSSQTTLPVVGVPLSGSPIEGIDALYSTVQMPKGIPVATVAIDNSANAAILVAQMLGITNLDLADKIQDFRDETRNTLNDHRFY